MRWPQADAGILRWGDFGHQSAAQLAIGSERVVQEQRAPWGAGAAAGQAGWGTFSCWPVQVCGASAIHKIIHIRAGTLITTDAASLANRRSGSRPVPHAAPPAAAAAAHLRSSLFANVYVPEFMVTVAARLGSARPHTRPRARSSGAADGGRMVKLPAAAK